MKRILPLLLALLLLTACASKGATIPQKPQRETDKTALSTQPPVASTQPPVASTQTPTTEPAPTEPESTEPQGHTVDEQLSALAQCGEQWFQGSEFDHYNFCVTDLDQDGRLELIVASMQGSGLFTFFSIYRVQDGSLQALTAAAHTEPLLPDLIVQSAPVYEEDGRYYYHFEDVSRNGVTEGMKDNVLFCLDADEPTVSYYDAEKVQIDEAAYERIVGDPMPDAKRWSAAFRWISAPDKEPPQEELLSMLTQSWEGFSLQPIE